jgi:hypothetical protein
MSSVKRPFSGFFLPDFEVTGVVSAVKWQICFSRSFFICFCCFKYPFPLFPAGHLYYLLPLFIYLFFERIIKPVPGVHF